MPVYGVFPKWHWRTRCWHQIRSADLCAAGLLGLHLDEHFSFKLLNRSRSWAIIAKHFEYRSDFSANLSNKRFTAFRMSKIFGELVKPPLLCIIMLQIIGGIGRQGKTTYGKRLL